MRTHLELSRSVGLCCIQNPEVASGSSNSCKEECIEACTGVAIAVGGMTIIDVATDEEAKMWGGKVGKACGWPQEIRKFKG